MPERTGHREAADHGEDHADDGDRHRRAAHGTEVGEVHLHAHAQQEEDHAELPEHAERLVRLHEREHRRADDHARDDLAHHRGDVDALGDLGCELRRDEDDEDVEEDPGDVHQEPLVSSRSSRVLRWPAAGSRGLGPFELRG